MSHNQGTSNLKKAVASPHSEGSRQHCNRLVGLGSALETLASRTAFFKTSPEASAIPKGDIAKQDKVRTSQDQPSTDQTSITAAQVWPQSSFQSDSPSPVFRPLAQPITYFKLTFPKVSVIVRTIVSCLKDPFLQNTSEGSGLDKGTLPCVQYRR